MSGDRRHGRASYGEDPHPGESMCVENMKELILQPQSEIGHFRRFLAENGYTVIKEDIVEEDGKYYPMMKAV